MTRRYGPLPFFDDATIAAALAKHGGDLKKARIDLGCCVEVVTKYCKRNCVERPYDKRVRWKAGKAAELEAMFDRSPRPSIREMADAFNTTPNAISTRLSRAGLTATGKRRASRRRPCVVCRIPFRAEGRNHRQCARCYAANSEIAA